MRLVVSVRNLEQTLKKLESLVTEIRKGFVEAVKLATMEARRHTPVGTGRLKNSIRPIVNPNKFEGRIVTDVPYARFVEFGHRRVIVPVRRKALRFFVDGREVFSKRVVFGGRGKSSRWERDGNIVRKPFLSKGLEWFKRNFAKVIINRLKRLR